MIRRKLGRRAGASAAVAVALHSGATGLAPRRLRFKSGARLRRTHSRPRAAATAPMACTPNPEGSRARALATAAWLIKAGRRPVQCGRWRALVRAREGDPWQLSQHWPSNIPIPASRGNHRHGPELVHLAGIPDRVRRDVVGGPGPLAVDWKQPA